jgi:hypothetical protein
VLNWLHRLSSRQLLAQLAAGTGPVTHDTLDQLQPAGAARHLRHILIAQKVLPDLDQHLHALQRWFEVALAEVEDPGEQRMLRGYLTWVHLRRLRNRDAPATAASVASIRDEIKSSIKLLTWLHDRGQSLHTCTQADLDAWCLLGGHMPHRARQFIAWCADRRFTNAVTIPAPPASTHREVFADEHARWRIARHLLHSDTNAIADRVAGLLVLLYGQPVARIVRLTTDNITHTGNQVRLLLGRQPLTAPTPLDRLLLELLANRRDPAALGRTVEHQWLFPGRLHGHALHPLAMGQRLKRLGIHSRIARNTALMDNAATMPAVALSELLGLSTTGAVRWTALAGSTGNAYAADLIRRPYGITGMSRAPRDGDSSAIR